MLMFRVSRLRAHAENRISSACIRFNGSCELADRLNWDAKLIRSTDRFLRCMHAPNTQCTVDPRTHSILVLYQTCIAPSVTIARYRRHKSTRNIYRTILVGCQLLCAAADDDKDDVTVNSRLRYRKAAASHLLLMSQDKERR